MYASLQHSTSFLHALEKTLADPGTLKRRKAFEKWERGFDRELRDSSEASQSAIRLDQRCDTDLIRGLLWRLSDDPDRPVRDDWRHLYGFDRRGRIRVATTLSNAASLLEKLNRAAVPKEFLVITECRTEALRVPAILRAYASVLSKGPRTLKRQPKDHHFSRLSRAMLIHHVQERMGRLCDRELADLYGVAAHKVETAENWAESRRNNPYLVEP
jgi:hypothetical protein